ncbi:hypothetical protein [Bradyrhizobium liaoningense]
MALRSRPVLNPKPTATASAAYTARSKLFMSETLPLERMNAEPIIPVSDR